MSKDKRKYRAPLSDLVDAVAKRQVAEAKRQFMEDTIALFEKGCISAKAALRSMSRADEMIKQPIMDPKEANRLADYKNYLEAVASMENE